MAAGSVDVVVSPALLVLQFPLRWGEPTGSAEGGGVDLRGWLMRTMMISNSGWTNEARAVSMEVRKAKALERARKLEPEVQVKVGRLAEQIKRMRARAEREFEAKFGRKVNGLHDWDTVEALIDMPAAFKVHFWMTPSQLAFERLKYSGGGHGDVLSKSVTVRRLCRNSHNLSGPAALEALSAAVASQGAHKSISADWRPAGNRSDQGLVET